MQVKTIKTKLIYATEVPLLEIIDTYIPKIVNGSVLVIASKIVSLCEGSVVDPATITKDKLIAQQAHLYLDRSESKYKTMFTITKNSLMLAAGIDSSNSSDSKYVLWPKDPLSTAKGIYEYLLAKNNITEFGVIIADSTSKPMRLGTSGIAIAHYGFSELNDYIGTKDLFGHKLELSRANVAEGLASSAVLAMGEGAEQTPLALISEVPFVKFNSKKYGSCYTLPNNAYKDDVYEPFWNSVKWHAGKDS